MSIDSLSMFLICTSMNIRACVLGGVSVELMYSVTKLLVHLSTQL